MKTEQDKKAMIIVSLADAKRGSNRLWNRKIPTSTRQVVAFGGRDWSLMTGRLYVPVSVAFYWSESGLTCWAALRIDWNGRIIYGEGRATGWGYHKESAAFSEAITAAGIKIFNGLGQTFDRIEGRGDKIIEDVMLALAESVGAVIDGAIIV